MRAIDRENEGGYQYVVIYYQRVVGYHIERNRVVGYQIERNRVGG